MHVVLHFLPWKLFACMTEKIKNYRTRATVHFFVLLLYRILEMLVTSRLVAPTIDHRD